MATATADFLTKLAQNQNLVLQLKAIISSDITDFDKLSDDQKKALFIAALAAGYKTNLELFLYLKLHPEKIGLPPLPPEKLETAAVNAQILAALVAEYENRDLLKKNIDTVYKNRSEKDRAIIEYLIRQATLKRQRALWAELADPKTQSLIKTISLEANPKNPPLPEIQKTVAEIIKTSVIQTKVPFTPLQIEEAIDTLTATTIAGLVNYSDPTSTSVALQGALGEANPSYITPISETLRQIEDNIALVSVPNYTSSAITQVTPSVAITLGRISLPQTEINPEEARLVLPLPLQDQAENLQTLSRNYNTKIITNPQSETVVVGVTQSVTVNQEKEFTKLLIGANLVTRIAPTQAGAATAKVIREINPENPFLSASVVRWQSMGANSKAVAEHLKKNPSSPIANFIHNNPHVLLRFLNDSQHLDNPANKLGSEITAPPRPGLFSGLATRYQSLTNTISGILPGRAGQIFNVITHPVQGLQNYLGNFIGNRIVGQFKDWIAKKFVSKIANETLKKGAEFILKQGLQQGVKLLAKEGLKRGLQAIAQVANIAPGAGLLLAAAIEAAFYLGGKVFGAAANAINGLFRAFTGEDFDARTALALPLAALAGIGGILASLGAATSIAAASAGVVLIASTAVGFFLYITVITVAPIITTIAHLESGVSDISRLGVIGESPPALIPPGPLPDSCPQGKPQSGYGITQGPNVGTHTSGWGINIAGVGFVSQGQAIDYGTPMDTSVSATHDGEAYFFQAGDNQPAGYGNYVAIIGSCLGNRFLTTYAHLNAGNIKRGGPTSVKRGQLIGLSDNTGRSTGPHLHYEIFGLGDIYRYVGP